MHQICYNNALILYKTVLKLCLCTRQKRVHHIPISPHGLLAMHYKPLLDKISGYLNAWAKKSISFAGRRELIASVLQGCEGFWLSILSSPSCLIESLVGICRGFLWRRPRVSWVNVCVPRKEGGLGLLNLGTWNKRFMMKLFWH